MLRRGLSRLLELTREAKPKYQPFNQAVVIPQLDEDTLYAFYDLDRHPISYDVSYFTVACEIERQKRKLAAIHIVFIPMTDMFAREVPKNYDDVVDLQSRLWRFNSICTEIPRLMPSVKGITVCASRLEATRYRDMAPTQYPARSHPNPHHADYFQLVLSELKNYTNTDWGLKSMLQARRYVRAWLEPRAKGRKPVVLTLRQYLVDADRNSDPKAWTDFAERLTNNGYFPIFVPDTDHAHEFEFSEYGNFTMFEPAAWSVGLRMALYELAYLNLFVNTGPNSIAVLNKRCRYLFFKVLVPGIALTSEDFLRWLGFEIGKSPNFATPFQKWVWETDSFEVIEREFKLMSASIGDNWENGDGN